MKQTNNCSSSDRQGFLPAEPQEGIWAPQWMRFTLGMCSASFWKLSPIHPNDLWSWTVGGEAIHTKAPSITSPPFVLFWRLSVVQQWAVCRCSSIINQPPLLCHKFSFICQCQSVHLLRLSNGTAELSALRSITTVITVKSKLKT